MALGIVFGFGVGIFGIGIFDRFIFFVVFVGVLVLTFGALTTCLFILKLCFIRVDALDAEN